MKKLKLNKKYENGRSMVEMLGVLAVIGVISVGGLTAYSYTMKRQRISQTIHQVSVAIQSARGLLLTKMDDGELDNNNCAPIRYIMPRARLCASNENAFQTEIGACVSVCRDANNIWLMNISFDEVPEDDMITFNDCQNILDSAVAQHGFLNDAGKRYTKRNREVVSTVCNNFEQLNLVIYDKN